MSWPRRAQSRQILAAITLLGFMLSLFLILNFIFKQHLSGSVALGSSDTTPIYKPTSRSISQPARLRIPSINLNAVIEPIGLTSQGDLGVPKGTTNVGWYDQGPLPGQTGDSVIDGHFGWWRDGTPAVFDNLYKLSKGDHLYVEDDNGTTTTFVVRKLQIYSLGQATSTVFLSTDNASHLNLITCEGEWDAAQQSYSNRLVVFTDKLAE